ncbi:hypothetical protein C922_04658 [Plasmodium inui San Antonio 1]|uniref:DUF155 domain-containing protein n=1 Tax=Plasmodium inui San Antonio 1 TaxID=1237626 RepID=W7AI14_9APIC|nr:hypothetical protein C922_04658 [Plasmodium inui San Antonio 1]EUD64926.1 hypothetical protein C922_04658 [Plasmodium inui San Antonio 1]
MDEHNKYQQTEDKTHKKDAKEQRQTYHYDSHRSKKGFSVRGNDEGSCSEERSCEGYSALRGDSGGSANSGMSTHGHSNWHSNGRRKVGINSGTERPIHSIRADKRTRSSREDAPSHRIFLVRRSSCVNPPSDTRVGAKRWLLHDSCRKEHSSYEARIRRTYERPPHIELSIPPTDRNGNRKKIQRRYTSHPNVSGTPHEVTPVRKLPRSRFAHKDDAIKIKRREVPAQWRQHHLGENAKVKGGTVVGLAKLSNLYKWSDDYHMHSSTRHATFHKDGHPPKTGKATKQKHKTKRVASKEGYTFKGEEEDRKDKDRPDMSNTPCGHKFYQVKFLCQAKGYDLKKISLVFDVKKIRYVFHDRDNILCAFLTPEKSTKYFCNLEDIGNIDNLNFIRDVTPSDAEYIVFIFINGSVVIWHNFPNCYRNDVFINNIIVFLNSYSDELLPGHVVQEDMMYYHEWWAEEEKHRPGLSAPSERFLSPSCVDPPLISGGVIHLRSGSLEQKLTVSFALSQSIRLDVHEMLMDITINKLFIISKQIASRGTCTISKQEVSRMLNVYSSIINVNAVQDFLDVPEYFWNKVQYEHAWFEIYAYLEIPDRIKILNKRYNYYKDFLKVIKTEGYNDKTFHTYRVIVLLLFIHVCALILNDLFFAQ